MDTLHALDCEEPYPFHLVEFINRGPKPKKRKIDIVATKWLGYNESNKKAWVFFPPPPYDEESSEVFNSMLVLLANPLHTWKKYTVNLKGRAKTYEEALIKAAQLQDQESVMTLESGESSAEVEARAAKQIKQNNLRATANSMKNSVYNSISAQAYYDAKENQSSTRENTKISGNTKDEMLQVEKKRKSFGASKHITTEEQKSKEYCKRTTMDQEEHENLSETSSTRTLSDITTLRNRTNSTKENDQGGRFGRQNCDIDNILIDYLARIRSDVAEIKEDIKDVKQHIQILQTQKTPGKLFVGCVQQIGEKCKFRLPFINVEEFEVFDKKLKTNENLKDDVCTVLQTGLDPALVISKCLVNMLKMFLSKDVANQYTAMKKTNTKKVMKTTNFFNCVELVIKERRKLSNQVTCDKDILTSLSCVLSNSCSWRKSTQCDSEIVNESGKRSNVIESTDFSGISHPSATPKRIKMDETSNEPLVIAVGQPDQQTVPVENLPIFLQDDSLEWSNSNNDMSNNEEEYSDKEKECPEDEKEEYLEEKFSADEILNQNDYLKRFQR